jgi:valyl-tRNA synthetase
VTPGHDPTDYQIGQRHQLPVISILDEEARVNSYGGPYAGLDRFEAREKLWEDMRAAGLVLKEEPYPRNTPRSQRGGEIIEPMISTQWFVRIQPMAEVALQAVREGQINIVPEHFTKVYYNWLENIEDWCISRQLWWGHRIPVWYCDDCGKVIVSRTDPTECPDCQGQKLTQDPDVLDTWFSSGLWPFSTLGWPDETPDYNYFYPTSVLETGYDILFFWVARMIMDGLEFTGKPPFHTVYLHGLIRDEKGQKMSKTKGNVIDPLVVMDELGTDALRFTLLVGSTPGNDTNLSLKRVEANRNFANKIWNAGRYVISSLDQAPLAPKAPHEWTLADSWIWARLRDLVNNVDRLFNSYLYGEAGQQIYEFFWGEFADWYVEISKLQLAEGGDRAYYTAYTLVRVLDTCLRLLHPFTPYVTEELWGHLKQSCQAKSPDFGLETGWEEALMVAQWPNTHHEEGWEKQKVADFSLVMDIIRAIRNLRAEKNVTPGKRLPATIVAGPRFDILMVELKTIAGLAFLDQHELRLVEDKQDSQLSAENQVVLVVSGVEIYLPLSGLVDMDAERSRLQKELGEIQSQVDRLEILLKGPFIHKAPTAVVEKERLKMANYKETIEKLKEQLLGLGE